MDFRLSAVGSKVIARCHSTALTKKTGFERLEVQSLRRTFLESGHPFDIGQMLLLGLKIEVRHRQPEGHRMSLWKNTTST